MNDDVIKMLRAANPVPVESNYDDDRVLDQVHRIAEPTADAQDITRLTPERGPRPGRRIAPFAAAAAVVVLAASGAVVAARHQSAGSGGTMTCQVSSGRGSSVSHRLAQAQAVITQRVRIAGGRADSFHRDVARARITFTPHRVGPDLAAGACAPTTAAVRTLLAASVPRAVTGPYSSVPLAGLGVAVPDGRRADIRLSGPDQARLRAAMARFDCSVGRPADAVLACGYVGGRTVVYLLGSVVVTGADVESATADAPGSSGASEWTVQLAFSETGAAAIRAVTTTSHSTDPAAANCSSHGVSCRNFLAIVVDGRVRIVLRTEAVITAAMQLSGQFTRSQAAALVTDLLAAGAGLSPVTPR